MSFRNIDHEAIRIENPEGAIEAQLCELGQGVNELHDLLVAAELAAEAGEQGVVGPTPYWPGIISAIRRRTPDLVGAVDEAQNLCRVVFGKAELAPIPQVNPAMAGSFAGVIGFVRLGVKVHREAIKTGAADLPDIDNVLKHILTTLEDFGMQYGLISSELNSTEDC